MLTDPQNYGVGNLVLPRSGPVVISATLDMIANQEADIDFTNFFQRDLISFIQGVFVDNWDGVSDLAITVLSGTGQRVIVPAHSQAWLPLFVPSGSTKFSIRGITAAPGVAIPVTFYNIPLQPVINRKTFPAA